MMETVTLEASGAGGPSFVTFQVEAFTSVSIRNSIVEPAEVSVELGDDTGWDRLSAITGLGSQYQVYVNDRPRIRGRIEAIDSPHDAAQGTVQRLVIRTKLSDAIYSSAPAGIRMRNISIRDFILACYASVGLTEADFDFRGDVSRNLMTGKSSKGGRSPVALDRLEADRAKVGPSETIFAAVDRHIRRHGLLHYDGPDGRIVVAAPNDTQDPIYFFRSFADAQLAATNNVLSATRALDVSSAPTHLGVFGKTSNADFTKAKLGAVVFNPDLIAAGFNRRVVVVDEGLRTRAFADRRASREFAQRNRGLDRLTITTDGLSYREGAQLIPYAPDTVADVLLASQGGALGAFYVESIQMERSAGAGDRTTVIAVRRGVWDL